MLAPRHEAVAPLPRAYRTPAHRRTAKLRLDELTRWLNWLPQQGIRSFGEVDEDCCAAYLAHRRHARSDDGSAVGDRSPGTRRAAAQVPIGLLNYQELFTADRLRHDLRPWAGASASAVAEMPSGRQANKTQPVPDHVLQPLLASAFYVVPRSDPARRNWPPSSARLPPCGPAHRSAHASAPSRKIPSPASPVLARHCQDLDPLPELTPFLVRKRLSNGWDPGRSAPHGQPGRTGPGSGVLGFQLSVAARAAPADRGGPCHRRRRQAVRAQRPHRPRSQREANALNHHTA